MPKPLAPLVSSLPEGIERVGLPTPFRVGDVNCWLLLGSPTTIIDPGTMIPESLARLEDFLHDAGLGFADIDQIVVTHTHLDHYGAAGWIAEKADAPILVGRPDAHRLFPYERDYTAAYVDMLASFGAPDSVSDSMAGARRSMRSLVERPAPERIERLDDLDTIDAGGRSWLIVQTPGHSVGHIAMYDDDVLVSGDHLLPHITPNPLIELTRNAGGTFVRRRSLTEYMASMDRFVEFDPAWALPGHGDAFTDVPRLIGNMRDHHRVRSAEVVTDLDRLGRATVYELAISMFSDLDGAAILLGLSEAVGHLDLLVAAGLAEVIDGEPVRYERVKASQDWETTSTT